MRTTRSKTQINTHASGNDKTDEPEFDTAPSDDKSVLESEDDE